MQVMKAAAFAAFAMASVPATAQTVTAGSPQGIVSALQSAGYQAELTKDSSGDPLIRSAASGARFSILFYGCTGGSGCTTVQFYAGFKSSGSVAVGKMNEWNRTKRFSRAYLDNDSDPCIEMDVNLDPGGMSRALFLDNLQVWSNSLGQFRTYIN